ncbi:hypothetical protein BaRGS_00006801 [Batillaria attramentaria]|uniref:Uncharacterized protein n=1 Tax=Batillaria attramentaria TaxID=370345 RepID=A0ABD0LR62_9CAEN
MNPFITHLHPINTLVIGFLHPRALTHVRHGIVFAKQVGGVFGTYAGSVVNQPEVDFFLQAFLRVRHQKQFPLADLYLFVAPLHPVFLIPVVLTNLRGVCNVPPDLTRPFLSVFANMPVSSAG